MRSGKKASENDYAIFFSKNAQNFRKLEFDGNIFDKLFLVHESFCEKWVKKQFRSNLSWKKVSSLGSK